MRKSRSSALNILLKRMIGFLAGTFARILTYSSFGVGGLLKFIAVAKSLAAIYLYQMMFNYYWNLAIPADKAV